MPKQLPPWSVVQLLDDLGYPAAGATIDTFSAGTTTPKTTWTESTGTTANTNPIVLDSAGRCHIWLTDGEAYKFVIKDSDGNTIETVDNIIAGDVAGSTTSQFWVNATYCGNPGAQAFLGGAQIVVAGTFPINFDGSAASVGTNPAASYVISVKKNGTEIGTITFATTGVATFATTGGATKTVAFNDRLTFVAPDTVGTAADILITLVGTL